MRASLKSFLSLIVALLLLGGSAAIGVWRNQRGAVGASVAELEGEAAPLLATSVAPPALPDGEPEAADPEPRRVPPAPVLVLPRAQLDLSADLASVRRALRRARSFEPEVLTALATLVDAEQRERTPELSAAIQGLVDDFHDVARERMSPAFLPAALQLANQLGSEAERFRNGPELLQLIEAARQREEDLADAESVLAGASASPRRLIRALQAFRRVLEVEPGNARAQRGIERIERRHIDRALALAADGDFTRAEAALNAAGAVREASSAVSEARLQLRTALLQAEAGYLGRFEQQLEAREYAAAATTVDRLEALPIAPERVAELRARLQNNRLYGGFRIGETFTDPLAVAGGTGPRMRVVPVGSFLMGAPESEAGRAAAEGPQRRLRIARGFALGITEVSVGEFKQFVDASGYRTDAERLGWSAAYQERSGRIARTRDISWRDNFKGDAARDKLPVVHVSHNDARAYATWLSEQTGERYRLPTEAEFEYALRAGTSTPYWWGEGTPDSVVENLTGAADRSRSKRQWNVAFSGYGDGFWGPAPVRSFKPNPFGLFDMGGNVSEWVEDCWHDSYARAPANSAAWVNPGCALRVLRGGSWGNPPAQSRSAYRAGVVAESRGGRVGFRVVREL